MHVLDEAWEIVRREFDAACSQRTRAARCQLTNELNQCLRRLRNYKTENEWCSAVVDGAARFIKEVALLSVQDGTLSLRGKSNLSVPENLSFPVSSAAAFAAAISSADPVVALRTPSEVGEAFSSGAEADRVHIVPISNHDRVVAVLFAAGEEYTDVNSLEVIAGLASIVLERRSNTAIHTQIAPASESKPQAPPKPVLPAWADLSEEQRSLHIRAQRFSRVAVAEMELARPEACRAGREQNSLYTFLRNEIDKARETYQRQFMTIPSMVDYLHLELIHSAAEGDEMKMGDEYPGQLV